MALVAFLGAAPVMFNPAKADEQRALAAREIRVNARQIPTFDIRSNETRFGALEYIGGMQINSPDALLGGISAMRLLPDGVRFVGAMDTGYLFTGRLVRDSDGRLSGLSDFVVAPMHGLDGQLVPQRWSADAEGLAIDGDRVLVSFERLHRIEQYRLSDIGEAVPMGTVSQPIPISESAAIAAWKPSPLRRRILRLQVRLSWSAKKASTGMAMFCGDRRWAAKGCVLCAPPGAF